MFEYLPELMKGLHTSLTLTVASLIVALILALIFTIILTLKTPVLVWLGGVISRCLPVRRCWCRSS
ncbi:arginine transporter permease subunit ArtM [Shigella sonnei]|nr:arginine transporter permease subunit ArtM [Shigella sonnei]